MKPAVYQISRLYIATVILCALTLVNSAAAADVIIETTDGRELSGEVDARTDEHLLWVRKKSEKVVLATSVPWKFVAAASEDGKSLPLENLSELLRPKATSEPVGFLVQQVVYEFPGEKRTAKKLKATPRIRSLEIDAFLVNLDRDVEPDGIELVIAAIDEHGTAVPVKGSLYAKLWGERIQSHGSHVRFEDLQQWTQPVKPADFFEGTASYALRFRKVRPEFDFGLHSDAVLQVRLGVSGQGNYAASVPIEIRAFSRFRDQLQLYQGSRFLRGEITEELRQHDRPRLHTRYRTWAQ